MWYWSQRRFFSLFSSNRHAMRPLPNPTPPTLLILCLMHHRPCHADDRCHAMRIILSELFVRFVRCNSAPHHNAPLVQWLRYELRLIPICAFKSLPFPWSCADLGYAGQLPAKASIVSAADRVHILSKSYNFFFRSNIRSKQGCIKGSCTLYLSS